MRLYKIELYKLCHKKIFPIGVIVTLAFTFLLFFQNYGGWDYFTSLYAIAMAMVSILTLCVISTVFSGETQCRVKPLLFTTQEGPGRDVHAKTAAAFTVAAGLWATVTLFALLIHGIFFGWDGLRCPAGLVEDYLSSDKLMMQSYGIYLAEVLTINLLGVLELCAITLAVSSRCRSTFSSVCTAALCWVVPMLALYMLRTVLVTLNRILPGEMDQSTLLILIPILSLIFFLLERLIYSAPIFMIWEGMLSEIDVSATAFTSSSVVVILAAGMLLLCAAGAYRRYRS